MNNAPHTLLRHIGLFNARAAAYLFEIVPLMLIGSVAAGPVIAAAIRHYDPWTRERGEAIGATASLIVHAIVGLVWFMLRDVVPGLSWGKVLMGLRVVRWRTGTPPGLRARAARNLLLFLPFFVVAEGICSLCDPRAGRRIGDWIAGTTVQHRTPPFTDQGLTAWRVVLGLSIWQLVLALALYACMMALQPAITEWAFEQAY